MTEFEMGGVITAEIAYYEPKTKAGDQWVDFKDAGIEIMLLRAKSGKMTVNVRKRQMNDNDD